LARWAETERPKAQLHGQSVETPYLLGLHFYQQAYPHIAEELWLWDLEQRQGHWALMSRKDLANLYLQQKRYQEAEELTRPYRSSEDKSLRRLYFLSLYWQREDRAALEELLNWGDQDFTNWETMENLLYQGVVNLRLGRGAGAASLWLLFSQYWENNLHSRAASFFREDPERYTHFDTDQALWMKAKSSWVSGARGDAWSFLSQLAERNPPWFTQGMVLAEWSYWAREMNRTRTGLSWLSKDWDSSYRKSYAYGRLQARARNHSGAVGAFTRSLELTQDPGLRDSSLLYLLRSAREVGIERLIQVLEEFWPSRLSSLDDFWDETRVSLVSRRDWRALGQLTPFLENWASPWVQWEWAFWQQYWPQQADITPPSDYSDPYNIGQAVGLLSSPVLAVPAEGERYYEEDWRPETVQERELAAYVRYGFWPEAFRLLKAQKDELDLAARWTMIRSFETYQLYHYSISLWQDLWNQGERSAEVFRGLFPRAFQQEIEAAAEDAGLPTALLYGLVREESRFNPKAGSHAGAQGLSQLMPATAEDVARRIRIQDYDVHLPADNLRIGAWYLAHRLDQFGNGSKALMAYNAGSGRVRRWERGWGMLTPQQYVLAIPIKETRRYVQKVLVSALWYSKLYGFEDPKSIIRAVF
jgi:soluble lytic murein transglycosylase-like protein